MRENIARKLCVAPMLMSFASVVLATDSSQRDAFRDEVERHAALLHLPGLSVGVMENDRVVLRQNIGFSDIESKTTLSDEFMFPIASVTKTFSAVMLMQYVREGRITLDDRVTSYPFASVGFFPERVTPDVRLKHVLSHTSEATPGETFIYHGGRFNFLAGVFNSVRGGGHGSFVDELHARIIEPLQLERTSAGYPDGDDSAEGKVVTPYQFNGKTRSFVPNTGIQTSSTAYPAAGLVSSVDDLLKYSAALDHNKLVDERAYRTMTTPMRTRSGDEHPYGLGWFVQNAHGVTMHWAYGLGGSDSALILRIPERELTLVVLSNCSFASEPFRFGSGNALNSPFVVSFLKHFVLPVYSPQGELNYDRPSTLRDAIAKSPPIYLDELASQVFCRTFIERKFGTNLHSRKLLRLLFEIDKKRFNEAHPSLVNLLSQHPDNNLDAAAECTERAFRAKPYNPEVEFDAARRLERKGLNDAALRAFRMVADHVGFEEQESTIEACSEAARLLVEADNIDRALEYQWRGIVYAYRAGYNTGQLFTVFRDLSKKREDKTSQSHR